MKKTICILLLVLSVCGCTKSMGVVPVTKGLSFSTVITYYNETYECDTKIDQNGVMTIGVTAPEDLKDLTFVYDGETVTARYMGLSYTPNTGSMPVGGVSQSIFDVFSDLWRNGQNAVRQDDNFLVEGKITDKSYRFYIAPTGLPLKLEIPDSSFCVEFNNVTIIK